MKTAPPAIVIGLDGASPGLVRRWTDSGDLPVLRGLIERGTFAPLRSTVPPVSPAAWSTFMTGMNPGGHGILGFRNLDSRRYELHEPEIVTPRAIAGRTFWDSAGRRGRKVGALWVPVTYPPWPVNGLLISGYPTPGSSRSYGLPESAAACVPGLTENSAFFNSARREQVRDELLRLARERGRVAAELLRRESFDLFVVVIGSTDRAQHDFWRHFDSSSPVHDAAEANRLGSTILDVYRAADHAVGEILEAAPEEAGIFVMSDHGGGPAATRQIHLNAWLRERGFLAVRPDQKQTSPLRATYRWLKDRIPGKEAIFRRLPPSLRRRLTAFDADATLGLSAVDWANTKAYRFPLYPPYEGIVVNLRDRQAEGCVECSEYETVRERILDEVGSATDPRDGGPIVARAFRREEVFSGPHLERFPDIVIEYRGAYAGGAELHGDWIADVPARQLRKLSGAHTMDGILIAAGPAIRRNAPLERAQIADVAPTVLYQIGLPHPETMDGRVLTELFLPEHLKARPVDTTKDVGPPEGGGGVASGYSESEQAEIAEQLRGLGYID